MWGGAASLALYMASQASAGAAGPALVDLPRNFSLLW